MSAPIACPECSASMSPTVRFCPSCAAPRTSVRLEIEQTAAATGIPYERLLSEARNEHARNPRPLETTAPVDVPAATVALPAGA